MVCWSSLGLADALILAGAWQLAGSLLVYDGFSWDDWTSLPDLILNRLAWSSWFVVVVFATRGVQQQLFFKPLRVYMSSLLFSYWSKQVIWPSPDSNWARTTELQGREHAYRGHWLGPLMQWPRKPLIGTSAILKLKWVKVDMVGYSLASTKSSLRYGITWEVFQ